jgi:hypothetical protein
MFRTFEICLPRNEAEANEKHFVKHLCALQEQFSLCIIKDVDVSKFARVRNSLVVNNLPGLTTCEQEHLIDTSCDGYLKDRFDADKLLSFGCF